MECVKIPPAVRKFHLLIWKGVAMKGKHCWSIGEAKKQTSS